MALVLKDRVLESSTSTGTGSFTLTGAQTGFQSFSVIGSGNTTYYTIQGKNPDGTLTGEWEVGVGTWSTGNTLSRDTVLSNSLGTTALISFSAGTKDVFCDYPASKSVNQNADNKVIIPYTSGVTNTGSLNVGDATVHTDSGVIAAFTASEPLYLYTSLQNTSSANTSYASYAVNDGGHTSYGELGINNSNYSYTAAGFPNNTFSQPLATFVECYGGPLAIGTWDNQKISFIVNGSVNTSDAMTISAAGVVSLGTALGVTSGGTGATTLTGYVKGVGTTAMTATALIPIADINATGTPSSTTYLRGDGTWSTVSGGSMVYPTAGIPNSTGSAWGTSYTTSGSGTVVALSDSPTITTALTVTGNLQLTGDTTATQNIATNQTTNALLIGGAGAASGTITIGRGTTAGAQTVQIGGTGNIITVGAASGIQPITIGRSGTALAVVNINTGGSGGKITNIASNCTSGTNTLNIGSTTTGLNIFNVGTSAADQTFNLATDATISTNAKTLNLATGAANIVNVSLGTAQTAIATNITIGGDLSSNTINIASNGGTSGSQSITIGSTVGTSTTTLNGIIKQQTYLVANLPTGSAGARSFVTNALAPTFGAAVAGGGAVGVPVYHDGTSWKVG